MFSRGRRLSQRQTSLRNGIKVFLLVRAGTALAMTAATAVERVFCDLYQNGEPGNQRLTCYAHSDLACHHGSRRISFFCRRTRI
jgi:hypothetical protein